MRPGNRNKKISLERMGQKVEIGFGETKPGQWVEICKEWAGVTYGRGDEQRQAARENASLAAVFNVLRSTKTKTLTTRDRINFDGATWDISSIVPIGSDEFSITATRAA